MAQKGIAVASGSAWFAILKVWCGTYVFAYSSTQHHVAQLWVSYSRINNADAVKTQWLVFTNSVRKSTWCIASWKLKTDTNSTVSDASMHLATLYALVLILSEYGMQCTDAEQGSKCHDIQDIICYQDPSLSHWSWLISRNQVQISIPRSSQATWSKRIIWGK